MFGADHPETRRDGRRVDALDPERMQSDRAADELDQAFHLTELEERDDVHLLAVDAGGRLGQALVDAERGSFRRVRELRLPQHAPDAPVRSDHVQRVGVYVDAKRGDVLHLDRLLLQDEPADRPCPRLRSR